MADLGTLHDTALVPGSIAYGINASGQVVGDSDEWETYVPRAFLYTGTPESGGAMVDLGDLFPDPAGSQTHARGINASGQVVGFSAVAPSGIVPHAFLYTGTPGSGGAMADLGTLTGPDGYSRANGINAGGQVVGDSAAHAFLYTGTPGSGGAMADLGTLTGKLASQGLAINDVGQVVGCSGNSLDTTDTTQHAFLYTGTPGSGGAMADLGTLGGTYSVGRAINISGQVAGHSKTTGGAQHAFLYTGTPGVDGHMIDLDTWLNANNPTEGAKWTLTLGCRRERHRPDHRRGQLQRRPWRFDRRHPRLPARRQRPGHHFVARRLQPRRHSWAGGLQPVEGQLWLDDQSLRRRQWQSRHRHG